MIAMLMKLLRCLLPVICAMFVAAPGHASSPTSELFVRPAELEPAVAFWRRVYTEVTTQGGLIHDPVDLSVVYEVIDVPSNLSPKQRSNYINEKKKKYARILDRLASGATDLTAEEQRVQALWPKGTKRSRFEQAAEEVRFQLGQADRFREGLVRSGAWIDHIAATFERMGLPRELSVLPHVESSFNPYAYSKVGAAGMWQFMRSTGRRFLRIDAAVDERLDPYRSTEAAARFLEQNYLILGTWPLALTAYNHGPAGMRRAQEQLGTSDIVTIIRKYEGRTFGFASRNFYAAFLAALEIDSNPEKFFGPIKRNPPDTSRVVEMPHFVPASRVAAALDMSREELRRLNPSLLPAVWSGARNIPKGFEFRVPVHVDTLALLEKLGPAGADAQLAGNQHRVVSGETLSLIASTYGVSMMKLAELNGLEKPYRLRVGQVLVVPDRGGRAPAVAVAQTPKAPAAAATAAAAATTGVAGPAESRYVVRRGDTLSRIASRHGMTEQQLMELNSIRNRNFIYEGQVLALAPSARVAPPPEATVPVESTEPPQTPDPIQLADAAEPVSEGEAEELGPTLVPGVQAAASADPSDYSVRDDNTIEVQATETLGHYAEWLNTRASQLRALNKMSPATPVVVGRRIKLSFTKVTRDEFEAKRVEYHRQLQENFFARYRINGNSTHVIRPGESIWVLAQQRYNLPIWLLRQYNPDVDLASLKPGTKLAIPLLEPVNGESSST
jgi:membrane-bound lytic murein transglycosylase D